MNEENRRDDMDDEERRFFICFDPKSDSYPDGPDSQTWNTAIVDARLCSDITGQQWRVVSVHARVICVLRLKR